MFLCLLWLLLATPASQSVITAARQHVERGYALAQSGDLKAAEAELRQAVKLAPDDALALAVLGMVLSQGANLEEANTYLERALTLDAGDTGTRYNLAVNQFRLGRLEAAQANLDRILKQKPDHKQAASLLDTVKVKSKYGAALDQYRTGNFAESQALLEQMTNAGNRDPKVFSLLAWCHHRQDRAEAAMAAMREAIELAPADATLYSNAAQILLENRSFQAASGAVTKALELAPDHAPALKLKGLLDIEHGDLKQAVASFQRAVELEGADPEALERLGTAQRMLFQYPEAAATFEKGIARFPAYARMYEAYGKLLLDPGGHPDTAAETRAVALLEKALALDASLPQAHYELAKLLLEAGKASEALRHLQAAAELDSSNSATHLALANAYRVLGRTADQSRELKLFRELEGLRLREPRRPKEEKPVKH
jgi:Flp pilus assembly protein TadD